MTKRGFTMLELLMAVTLLGIMSVIVLMTFNTVISNWMHSVTYVDRMQHADYALQQVISGLRSAYYPSTGKQDGTYGFMLLDNGDGEDYDSSDTIQWTKLGSAVVGSRSVLSETPHTVALWVQDEKSDEEPAGLWVRAWRTELQPDEFDPSDEEYVKPYLLVKQVRGFNCRVIKKPSEMYDSDDILDWKDEWSGADSNSIPYMVELTFKLDPVEEDGEPITVRRRVELPLWDVSQEPLSASSSGDKTSETVAPGGRTGGRGGRR